MKSKLESAVLATVLCLAGCGGAQGDTAGAAVAPVAAATATASSAESTPVASTASSAPTAVTAIDAAAASAAAAVPAATAASVPPAPPSPASPDSTWYTVAQEYENYTVAAPAHLRFGTPQQWVYKDAAGPFACSVEYFKADPNPGVVKQCQTDDPAAKGLKVKVMMIGDSITSFYRDSLWSALQAAGMKSVDFVGNAMYSWYPGTGTDPDFNGYGGYKAQYLLNPAGTGKDDWGYLHGDERDVTLMFRGQAPDIVLIELGTNDACCGDLGNPVTELQAFMRLVDAARAKNPAVRIFVAQITPTRYGPPWTERLNVAIPPWAALNSTAKSPITVVDQYTGFDWTMTRDDTHPGDAMGAAMGKRWFTAIAPFLR